MGHLLDEGFPFVPIEAVVYENAYRWSKALRLFAPVADDGRRADQEERTVELTTVTKVEQQGKHLDRLA